MPTEWRDTPGGKRLTLWPYRSLPRRGFVWFMGMTLAMFALPLAALIGRSALWGLLPFMALVTGGLWWAISHSWRTGTTQEILTLTRDRIALTRSDPGQPDRTWSANPYWIRATIRPGPVEDYLILSGDHESGREIELGAFLTAEERRSLHSELNRALSSLR